ncbi:MAG: family 78 glycoside hydrolase catalytic domain, partial [Verrucomicrobia bacterium]|nr:family 78 glycoside hydrolase catalytic domain [Verrucomicrobiota bacterium]
VLVASSAEILAEDKGDLWDSGKCESDRTTHIAYGGKGLRPRMRCFWKVRVWDKDGTPLAWSKPAMWSTGLFLTAEPSKEQMAALDARWIGAGSSFEEDPWLRKSFELVDKPVDALAYVASIGYHELFINGKKVGDSVLAPSTSDLSKRARYVTYDITPYLHKGKNTMALWLGAGWAKWEHYHVADKPLVMAEIDVALPDGKTVALRTDETWKIHSSSSTLMGAWKPGQYGGEHIDTRKRLPDWNTAGFDDSKWESAKAYTPELKLSAEKIESNRKVATLEPIGIEEVEPGVYRVDMGRNFSGWIEIRFRGEPEGKVDLSFSEHADGSNKFNLRSACTLDDRGRGIFHNRFNYSSGRWITITGLSHPPDLSGIKGYVIRNDYKRASRFKCSNPLLNQIHDTVLWTFESLSLGGYVVDCPHRERMGYGGDAHATMEMALNHYGMGAFLTKWIEDWRDVQKPNGDLPYTAPTQWGGGGPAWSGVCVTLPWAVYERYADLRILKDTYPTMQRWIGFLDTKAHENMLVKWGGRWDFLGDWVPPGKDQGDGRVDEYSTLFFNNCYYLYNVKQVAEIAELLGKEDEAKAYRKRAEKIRKAVHQEFFNPKDNTYANGDQLYMALPLLVGVTPEELRQPVMQALENEIMVAKNGHIDTGIHGTYFLIKTLTELNRSDLIFEMASKRDYPSWGHMLENGATTIWEQWDGEHSHLHSSFLSIGAWFIEGVAGIQVDPRQPGYKHFIIKPGMIGDLTWAKGELDSIHGKIVSDWKIEDHTFTLNITIPANTTATVHVPAKKATDVSEGGRPTSTAKSLKFLRMENGRAVFSVDSGSYQFVSKD